MKKRQQVLPSKGLKIKLPASKGLSRPAAEPHAASGAQSSSVDTASGSHILKRKRAAVDLESSADSDSESEDPAKTEKGQKKRLRHSTPSKNVPKK